MPGSYQFLELPTIRRLTLFWYAYCDRYRNAEIVVKTCKQWTFCYNRIPLIYENSDIKLLIAMDKLNIVI